MLNALGLSGFFELVIGGDTLSEKKPSARTIEFCAEHMGMSLEHAAHVGDSVIDIETARNANVACIAVSFGYNGGVLVVAGKPDLIIDHFDHLANYVLDSDQTRQLIA